MLQAHKSLQSHLEIHRVLFVCTANIQRSLAAEHLFKKINPQIAYKSAGVSKKECTRHNSKLCTERLLNWADIIFVFEQMHIDRIRENTGGSALKKIVNLEIEDTYQYNDPDLIKLLTAKLNDIFS